MHVCCAKVANSCKLQQPVSLPIHRCTSGWYSVFMDRVPVQDCGPMCMLLLAVYRNWVRDQVDKDPELAAQWQQWEAQVRTPRTLPALPATLLALPAVEPLAGDAG